MTCRSIGLLPDDRRSIVAHNNLTPSEADFAHAQNGADPYADYTINVRFSNLCKVIVATRAGSPDPVYLRADGSRQFVKLFEQVVLFALHGRVAPAALIGEQ